MVKNSVGSNDAYIFFFRNACYCTVLLRSGKALVEIWKIIFKDQVILLSSRICKESCSHFFFLFMWELSEGFYISCTENFHGLCIRISPLCRCRFFRIDNFILLDHFYADIVIVCGCCESWIRYVVIFCYLFLYFVDYNSVLNYEVISRDNSIFFFKKIVLCI